MENETKTKQNDKPANVWHDAVIGTAEETLARSGQRKLFVRTVVVEGNAVGTLADAHILLGDSVRGRALLRGLAHAVGTATETLPKSGDLLGKRVQIRIEPWLGADGRVRQSIIAFSSAVKKFSANDNTVTITVPPDHTPC